MDDRLRRTIDYYDLNPDTYSQRERTADMSAYAAKFSSMLQPGARILDAGCGSGRDAKYFSERGFQAVGIDLSSSLLRMARKHAFKAAFLMMDLSEPGFKEQSFDGLWMSASLLHIPGKQAAYALRQLSRTARQGSPVYISVIAGHGERTVPFEKNTERTFTYYYADGLESLVLSAGFTAVSVSHRKSSTNNWLHLYARKA